MPSGRSRAMRFRYMSTQEALDAERLGREGSPLDPGVIPNYMGINLSSVQGFSWTIQDDGQLVQVSVHFLPAAKAPKRAKGGLRGA